MESRSVPKQGWSRLLSPLVIRLRPADAGFARSMARECDGAEILTVRVSMQTLGSCFRSRPSSRSAWMVATHAAI